MSRSSALPVNPTEFDTLKAESIRRGRMLLRMRKVLISIRDGILDEGDLCSFGSTNHADEFRDLVEELDGFQWEQLTAEKGQPDVFERYRQASRRASKAEADVRRLEAEAVELRRFAVEAAELRTEVARLRAAGTPAADPVVEAVREELRQRSEVGVAKYGCTLGDSGLGLRAFLRHAFEESLDFSNYLQGALMQLDGQEASADRAPV